MLFNSPTRPITITFCFFTSLGFVNQSGLDEMEQKIVSQRKHVSMDSILLAIRSAEIYFKGGQSTLTKLLKVTGFKWQKDCAKRIRFLREYLQHIWSKDVDHCERLIKEDWDRETRPPIIINLAEDDVDQHLREGRVDKHLGKKSPWSTWLRFEPRTSSYEQPNMILKLNSGTQQFSP
uniref:Uncharacterized protein n=1 Tax=Timema douglasi TaxID=61478 RepID=A0A7R8VR47_TIMDO|nr:unnamed protein product [Timema douglasi]